MKAVMLMFDSLNRHMLPPSNPETWMHAPNFRRLAERAVTFERSYVCSMPCMPARRDLHTGRPNFLHTSWGPMEPFDDSVPQMLSKAGVHTHLATDHYHYFEDGGATYHGRYDTWQFYRGQEGDPHIGQLADPPIPENINQKGRRSDWVNRQFQQRDEDFSQTQTLHAGIDFIDRNADYDGWFVQIECFDPHEPFVADQTYHDLYAAMNDQYDGPLLDWPGYREVTETPEQVEHAKRNYAALMSKCDDSLGRVLAVFDRHNLWEDTMLIVWTDHGFMLGEHGCWAKNWMPLYEEVSHTPLFIYDPRHKETVGQRRDALVQPAIDLGPTLLEFFGLEHTADMTGQSLTPVIANDEAIREAAIFGYHGDRVNVTDGRFVYYRLPRDTGPLHRYTLMPTNMRGFVGVQNLEDLTLAEPFGFTKGVKPLCIKLRDAGGEMKDNRWGDLLFDLEADPHQQRPIEDDAVKQRLCEQMKDLMEQADAPAEQYQRMGLN